MAHSTVPSSMRAPRFEGAGRGDLLVAVKANALCGSERGQFHSGSSVTPGHEAAGVVVAAGPDTAVAHGTPGVVFLPPRHKGHQE